MSDEDIPPLKYVDYKKVDFEKGETEIDWNNEEIAVEFMLNLVGHKVTGVEKHILMNHIHQKFIKKTGIDVGTTQLWSKLNTMYDLEQLESHQNLPPWDDSQVDFQLPKELLPTPPPVTPSSGKKEFLLPSKRVKEEVIETPHKNSDANSKKRATNPHKTPSSTRSKDHSSRSSSSKKDHKKDYHSSKKDHHSSKKDSSRKRHLRTPNTGSTKKKSRK